ncbi:MAG: tetratricopeptide repeat protein [Candidatus Omnitrophica bacterium]|nr:tetratricopeptide repeat protein [Candidatus Omnitrophota bacterium]
MKIKSRQELTTSVIAAIIVSSFGSFVFAQDLEQNQGYVGMRRIPENKKGTVYFGKSSLDTPTESEVIPWQETSAGVSAVEPAEKPRINLKDIVRPAEREEDLTELQKEARQYRQQGLEFQNMGDLDSAMKLYQKAIVLDPGYAVVYNDLGVILESRGMVSRAEECYLKSLKIDPDYMSAYTNLALLYEGKRDLDKAYNYWKKRAELGIPDDPWTLKARQRMEDISAVITVRPMEEAREQEVMRLLKEVAVKKELTKKSNKAQAREVFDKARLLYKKGDEVTALKLAIDAQQLDPTNNDIDLFIRKLQTRVLSR